MPKIDNDDDDDVDDHDDVFFSFQRISNAIDTRVMGGGRQ